MPLTGVVVPRKEYWPMNGGSRRDTGGAGLRASPTASSRRSCRGRRRYRVAGRGTRGAPEDFGVGRQISRPEVACRFFSGAHVSVFSGSFEAFGPRSSRRRWCLLRGAGHSDLGLKITPVGGECLANAVLSNTQFDSLRRKNWFQERLAWRRGNNNIPL